MSAKVGDTVRVRKWVYDRDYVAEGVVTATQTANGAKLVKVGGDWYEDTNDATHRCEIITRKNNGKMTNGDLAARYGISLETLRKRMGRATD